MLMLDYNTIEEYYSEGFWCVDQVHKAVNNGIISSQDFYNITGREFRQYDPKIFIINEDLSSPQSDKEWIQLFYDINNEYSVRYEIIYKTAACGNVRLDGYKMLLNGAELTGATFINNQIYQFKLTVTIEQNQNTNRSYIQISGGGPEKYPGQTFYIPVTYSFSGVGVPNVIPPLPGESVSHDDRNTCEYYCDLLENNTSILNYPINLFIQARDYETFQRYGDIRYINTFTWIPLTQIAYDSSNATIIGLIFEQSYVGSKEVYNSESDTWDIIPCVYHAQYVWDKENNNIQVSYFDTEANHNNNMGPIITQ